MNRLNVYTKVFAVLLCAFTSVNSALAGHEKLVAGVDGSSVSTGAYIEVKDPYQATMLNYGTVDLTNKPEKSNLEKSWFGVRLWLDENGKEYFADDWTCQVDYSITLETPGDLPVTLATQQINIDYSPVNNYQDMALIVYENSVAGKFYTGASITVTGVTMLDDQSNSIDMPAGVHLDLEYRCDRYYVLEPNNTPNLTATLINSQPGGSVSVNNELVFNWNKVLGAESYDLEWLFIDGGSRTQNQLGAVTLPTDWSNATRISTNHNNYTISLTYPSGYLAYRIRAVGVDAASSDFEKFIYGNWSFDNAGSSGTMNADAAGAGNGAARILFRF